LQSEHVLQSGEKLQSRTNNVFIGRNNNVALGYNFFIFKVFMVSVNAGELISMGGSQDPAAHVAFASIGKIDEESNKKYHEILFRMLNTKHILNAR